MSRRLEIVVGQTKRAVDMIIIHCSATTASMDIGVKEIRDWHVTGNGWTDIGYHYVIRRDGAVEKGREDTVAGAHCQGKNARSIGVCMVGGIAKQADGKTVGVDNFTPEQWKSLESVVKSLKMVYPLASIHGHSEFSSKECPCFDVTNWWTRVY